MKFFVLILGFFLLITLAHANTPPASGGYKLEPLVEGLEMPVYITQAPGNTEQFFVVEKSGQIRLVENGTVQDQSVLDIRDLVSTKAEQGLLGLAFHPDFEQNGYIFINYTDFTDDTRPQNTQIVRYTLEDNIANPDSAKTILTISQPHSNHNGGMIAFGPDGYLYIGMGDGGSGGDPYQHGQNMDSLLGKVLRIDINTDEPYVVPDDNPFVGQENVRPEIWTVGWRNPWRWSFDRETGDMWLGDVGQDIYEEISFQAAGQGGGNYGWRCYEAMHEYDLSENCEDKEFIEPVFEYEHSEGASVTGGYAYRGEALPDLQGTYIYGDFTSGKIWFATQQDGEWTSNEWLDTELFISSFGEDNDGELYVVDYSGAVYQLTAE
ncbi:MAG: PQQ-dependent sugar dehydrogenase [Trueperaceae bacterium]